MDGQEDKQKYIKKADKHYLLFDGDDVRAFTKI